nr:hypothetical protein [Anaeromyxobacter sp. SG17]
MPSPLHVSCRSGGANASRVKGGRVEPAEILEEDPGHLARHVRDRPAFGRDAEAARQLEHARLALDREVCLAVRGGEHREHRLVRVTPVRREPGDERAQHVADDHRVLVLAADAALGARADPARPPLAHPAASTGEAERALRLLLLEPVEERLDPERLEPLQELAGRGVRRRRDVLGLVRHLDVEDGQVLLHEKTLVDR